MAVWRLRSPLWRPGTSDTGARPGPFRSSRQRPSGSGAVSAAPVLESGGNAPGAALPPRWRTGLDSVVIHAVLAGAAHLAADAEPPAAPLSAPWGGGR